MPLLAHTKIFLCFSEYATLTCFILSDTPLDVLSKYERTSILSSNLTEKITTYKNSEGVIDSNAIQLVQENYYYIGPFIKQKFDFDDLPEAPEESTTTYADTSTGTDSGSSGSEGSEGSEGREERGEGGGSGERGARERAAGEAAVTCLLQTERKEKR